MENSLTVSADEVDDCVYFNDFVEELPVGFYLVVSLMDIFQEVDEFI